MILPILRAGSSCEEFASYYFQHTDLADQAIESIYSSYATNNGEPAGKIISITAAPFRELGTRLSGYIRLGGSIFYYELEDEPEYGTTIRAWNELGYPTKSYLRALYTKVSRHE